MPANTESILSASHRAEFVTDAAGSAGVALTARLTEIGKLSVLLLEAGAASHP